MNPRLDFSGSDKRPSCGTSFPYADQRFAYQKMSVSIDFGQLLTKTLALGKSKSNKYA
jgi:hypothetical protein